MFMFLTVAGPYWNISNPRHNDAVLYVELPLLYLKQQGQQSKIGTSEFTGTPSSFVFTFSFFELYIYFLLFFEGGPDF